ncbi:MAG: hypothetical protein WCA31_09075 [Acidimicrobiales bacterium]
MVAGVLFSFLASACFSVSNLMEKQAVTGMAEITVRHVGHLFRALCSSRVWLTGFVISVVSIGITIVAYSLAPIMIVQTIMGAGLALLVLASRLYLHEPLGQKERLGLVTIIVAVVLVSLTLNSTAVAPHISVPEVLAVSAATVVIAGAAFGVLHRRTFHDASLMFGSTSGLLYGIAALQMKSISVLLEQHGLLGGITRVLASPYPYLFVGASLLGLIIFQSGLQRCRISVVGPVTNIVASVYVVVVGGAIFHESLPRETDLTLLRLLGFAFVLVGSLIFATGPATPAGVVASSATPDE